MNRSASYAGLLIGSLFWTGAASAAGARPLGRVSVVEGSLTLRPVSALPPAALGVNAILEPGDRLLVPYGSLAELELEGRSFVRLAGGSQLDLDAVGNERVLVLHTGAAAVSRGGDSAPLRLAVLGALVELEPGAEVRVDADRDTLVASARVLGGSARFVLAEEDLELVAGDGVRYAPGQLTHLAEERQHDAFYAWVERRHQRVAGPGVATAPGMVGDWELADAGEWVMVENRRCFRPRVAATWRPYSVGVWSWVPEYGWVWVPSSSWEYVTGHYGRWILHSAYGWVWVPMAGWGPAYVAWAVTGPYVAWSPLDLYDRAPGSVCAYDCDGWLSFWLVAELAYFWDGGGHPAPGQTIVVDVDVDVIVANPPAPVDDPKDDLAPPGAGKGDNLLAHRIRDRGLARLERAEEQGKAKPPRIHDSKPAPTPPKDASQANERRPLGRPAATSSYGGVSTAAPARPTAARTPGPEPAPVRVPARPRPRVSDRIAAEPSRLPAAPVAAPSAPPSVPTYDPPPVPTGPTSVVLPFAERDERNPRIPSPPPPSSYAPPPPSSPSPPTHAPSYTPSTPPSRTPSYSPSRAPSTSPSASPSRSSTPSRSVERSSPGPSRSSAPAVAPPPPPRQSTPAASSRKEESSKSSRSEAREERKRR